MSILFESRTPDFPDESIPRRPGLLIWVPWAMLGWLVFELTAEPALGIVVGCLKFGAGDVSTAWWLRRRDPQRRRGRACSWFFLARACGAIGGSAFFFMFLVGFVLSRLGGRPLPGDHLQRQLMAAVLLLLLSIGLGSLFAWIGMASALLARVPVWIDATAGRARRAGLWPPLIPERSAVPAFSARVIAIFGLITAPIGVLALTVIAHGFLTSRLGFFRDPGGKVLLSSLAFLELVTLALVVRLLRRLHTYSAATPATCYPELFLQPRPPSES